MIRRLLLLAVLFLLLFPAFSWAGADKPAGAPETGVAVGDLAPDFTLKDVDGKSYTLSELRDKVVLINFWATWCPPCRREMPSMERLNSQLKGEDFVLLAVNVEAEGREIVREFLEEHPHSFPVLLDDQEEVYPRYGVFRFPETFILRRDGVIADHVIGAVDWTEPKIVNLIKFLIHW